MNSLPNRITGATVTIFEGVCVVSRHTTSPQEFDALCDVLGRPTLVEREADGIPYVTASVDGVGWRVTINLMARTLQDMHIAA